MSGPRTRLGSVGVFSRGIMRIPHLTTLLGADELIFDPSDRDAARLDAVVGWGRKPNTIAPARFARRHELSMFRLEDGFVRSVGLGVAGAAPLSIVVDDVGMYYDATSPSRLERWLEASEPDDPVGDPGLLARSKQLIERLARAGVSKYNDAPPRPDLGLPDDGRRRILVVDQTAGDMSIELGGLRSDDYETMLESALDEHPDAEIVVKTHPDVLSGKKRGCVPQRRDARIRWLATHVSPYELFSLVDQVYVGTSQLGLEALIAGKTVTCFGCPFYAGWGPTRDRNPLAQRRSKPRSLEQIVAAAYLLYARYLQPGTWQRGSAEDVVEHLALQRSMFLTNSGHSVCVGLSRWKRGFISEFLRSPGNRVQFVSTLDEATRENPDSIVTWGQSDASTIPASSTARHLRVEDGFLRSVGLGSDLVTPASLVFDSRGIYFDPRSPSDLEHILVSTKFTTAQLARAVALREAIVQARVSKYVVGDDAPLPRPPTATQRVALIPGQVEGDASIRLGCVDVRTNGELIRAVRDARPSAFVVYKPHPDVVSGNRKGDIDEEERSMCDLIVDDRTLDQCLDLAEEVHTMTSLVGFEALLRGKQVHVYGRPFYAGWGLTEDRHAVERRTRKLSLDELVAGTLICYPRYLDPETREFTTPEATLAYLERNRHRSKQVGLKAPWLVRQTKKLLEALKEIRRAR